MILEKLGIALLQTRGKVLSGRKRFTPIRITDTDAAGKPFQDQARERLPFAFYAHPNETFAPVEKAALKAHVRFTEVRRLKYEAMEGTIRIRYMCVTVVLLSLATFIVRWGMNSNDPIRIRSLLDRSELQTSNFQIDYLQAIATIHTELVDEAEGDAGKARESITVHRAPPAPQLAEALLTEEMDILGSDLSEDESSSSTSIVSLTPRPVTIETDEHLLKIPNQMTNTGMVFSGKVDMPEFIGKPGERALKIKYPESARLRSIQGRTIVSFRIDPDGFVRRVGVLISSHPTLDSAAVRAIRNARFEPARREGHPIAMDINLPISFLLIGRR